jgi:hypothetical protein
MNTSDLARQTAIAAAVSDRDHGSEHDERGTASPWVLVATLADPKTWWVVAEGAQPRQWTRLSRTRIAGSSTLNRHIPPTIGQAISSREPQVRSLHLPSRVRMRIIAVPVLGPSEEVFAVQVWAGPRLQPVPPRPAIGTLAWWNTRNGVASTDPTLERLIDSSVNNPVTRALPDLMRHFERMDDTTGLLRLFDENTQPITLWCGTAVTAGITTRARRNLFLAAASVRADHGRTIRALVHDISDAQTLPPPTLQGQLMRTVPIRSNHAVGVTDLTTGLIYLWVETGPPPLDRWMYEIPETHPDDLARVAETRARLLAGAHDAQITWRLRFDTTSWVTVHGHLTVLTRDLSPQAMLDLHLEVHRGRSTPRRELSDPPELQINTAPGIDDP